MSGSWPAGRGALLLLALFTAWPIGSRAQPAKPAGIKPAGIKPAGIKPAATAVPAPAVAPPVAPAPAPVHEHFAGRGVSYFPGRVRCPLAGVGSRGDYHSNRVALDDDYSQVDIDRGGRRILFTNTQDYAKKQLVGDLLFLGIGTTTAGLSSSVGIHLKLEKKGDTFVTDVHAHPTARESLVSTEFEPFQVLVRNGKTETVVLTAEQALQAIREPGFGLRLASKLLAATDNLEGQVQDPTRPGYVLVDISFGIGLGGLSKQLIRGQILSVDTSNAALIQRGSLPEMMRTGVWELRLRALSNLDGEDFARDLFLIRLDGVPILAPLAKDGMDTGGMMTIRLRNGHGTVFFGNQGQPIKNAADVARDYLEFNGLGAILASQVGAHRGRNQVIP